LDARNWKFTYSILMPLTCPHHPSRLVAAILF